MIFSGELADKVLAGTKTQTRRPLVTGRPCQYKVGSTYAIQRKRGTFGLGPRIKVLAVTPMAAEEIHPTDAIAEGFASREEFIERWRSFYGTKFPMCWCIVFELVGADE